MAWVDVADWHAHEWLNAADYPGGVAQCLCDLWAHDAGVTAQARLVSLLTDGTVDAVVGTSATVTATVPTGVVFQVVLTGYKAHKLQVESATSKARVFCSPDAKVVV